MALTKAEKQRILGWLDGADADEKEKILSSKQSFGDWLSKVSYAIYYKVRDALSDFWSWLVG